MSMEPRNHEGAKGDEEWAAGGFKPATTGSAEHTETNDGNWRFQISDFIGWISDFRVVGVAVTALALGACAGPDLNAVANRLREENLQQKRQLGDLQDKIKVRDATIRDLQEHFATNNPPLETLPPERLAEVFTASRLEIQGQTEAADLGEGKQGLRVFVRTYAEDGQIVPAAGALTVEAFELPVAPAEPKRIGVWTFTAAEMKRSWFTGLGLNHFALSCPWQTVPSGREVVIRVRLRDALTGGTLEGRLDKKIAGAATGTGP